MSKNYVRTAEKYMKGEILSPLERAAKNLFARIGISAGTAESDAKAQQLAAMAWNQILSSPDFQGMSHTQQATVLLAHNLRCADQGQYTLTGLSPALPEFSKRMQGKVLGAEYRMMLDYARDQPTDVKAELVGILGTNFAGIVTGEYLHEADSRLRALQPYFSRLSDSKAERKPAAHPRRTESLDLERLDACIEGITKTVSAFEHLAGYQTAAGKPDKQISGLYTELLIDAIDFLDHAATITLADDARSRRYTNKAVTLFEKAYSLQERESDKQRLQKWAGELYAGDAMISATARH